LITTSVVLNITSGFGIVISLRKIPRKELAKMVALRLLYPQIQATFLGG
jgi:hypothetical protein